MAKRLQTALLFFFFAAFIFLPTACGEKQKTALAAVEIKNYEGKDLSSIDDFQENSIRGPQTIEQGSYRLTLTGLVDKIQSWTYDELIATMKPYEKVVTLYCVEGWNVDILWEGFLFKDLLAGVTTEPAGDHVIFHAADGYTTMLPLAYLLENDILLAYKMNGVILPPERGFPFQLVAEEKLGYKWIKWITRIEISDDAGYLGYWESRGFPQGADTNGK